MHAKPTRPQGRGRIGFTTAWIGWGLIVALPAAAYAHDMKQIGPERETSVEVAKNASVDLRLPPGELRVERADGSTLKARMTVRCPEDSKRCAEALSDLDFAVSNSGNRVTVRTNKRLTDFRFPVELDVSVEVPSVRRIKVESAAGELRVRGVEARTLDLDLKAGELDVKDVDACPHVDMVAGEARISIPEQRVASVELDAGVGDVRLTRGSEHYEGRRSWLIGAELEWDEGPGMCDLDIDVQTGEAIVRLTD